MKRFFLILLTGLLVSGLCGCTSNFNAEDRTSQYMISSAITSKVRTNIAAQLGIISLKYIAVSTFRGVVKITGTVRSQSDMQKALKGVSSTVGVIAIQNCLKVNPNAPWS